MTDSIHKGHRERLKQRFLQEHLDHFDEINALELLLFYCIPKQDTNPIAHRLLDEFGSFKNVLEADYADLKKVKGMGEHSAIFLSLLKEVCRYYSVRCAWTGRVLTSIEDCGAYIKDFFMGLDHEVVYMLSLDGKSSVISCKQVGEGSVNSANVPIRRVVELALRENASSVVLAHNHPSGLALPSREDVSTTLQVANALNMVDIKLVDHIVVAGDDFVSLVQSGYYDSDFSVREGEYHAFNRLFG